MQVMSDFQGWYCSLAMSKSTYDHARQDCAKMEGSIQEIQSKILTSIDELLGMDVHASNTLHLEELKEKMKFIYFNQLKSLKKSQIDDLVSLMVHINSLQKLMPDWENALNSFSNVLDVIDAQQEALPNITMEELNLV